MPSLLAAVFSIVQLCDCAPQCASSFNFVFELRIGSSCAIFQFCGNALDSAFLYVFNPPIPFSLVRGLRIVSAGTHGLLSHTVLVCLRSCIVQCS